MRVRLGKTKAASIYLCPIILFVALCEFLYAKNTGDGSAVLLVILWGFALAYNLKKREKFTVHDVLCLLISVVVLLYSYNRNSESVRYFLLLTAMIFWSKVEMRGVEKLTYALVISSLILSVIQIIRGFGRTSGLFANSPTQMSCLLLVCETYLLVRMVNKGIAPMDLICCCLCIPMLFFTESRSTLAAGGVVFVVYMALILVKTAPVAHKKAVFFAITIPLTLLILFSAPKLIDLVMSKMKRTNSYSSTMTRMVIYQKLLSSILESLRSLLIGKGGGFVEMYLGAYFGISVYFPAHQDFLLIMCEYGLMGLLAVMICFLWKHKMFLYFLLVFGVCSFHNVLLTPTTMIFMVVTMVDLEKRHYKLWL